MSDLRSLLIRHEGLTLKAYLCPAGKITVGVGRNLEDAGISEAEAMVLLDNDIERCRVDAAKAFPWFKEMGAARQDVVLSMIFNLGLKGFQRFSKAIQAIEAKNYDLAASELMNSHWAAQVGKRAVDLADMMRTGEYSS